MTTLSEMPTGTSPIAEWDSVVVCLCVVCVVVFGMKSRISINGDYFSYSFHFAELGSLVGIRRNMLR